MDELPYDEMDPCCQKEIDAAAKRTRVTAELRQYDRSNDRLDVQGAVLGNVREALHCECCVVMREYPLLRETRRITVDKRVVISDQSDDLAESDSDVDSLLDDMPLTAYEQERLLATKEQERKQRQAETMMFGVHVEDSVQHIQRMLSEGAPLVCHLYDPTSSKSAYLDLILERIATRHLGTRFRRAPMALALVFAATNGIHTTSATLTCFKGSTLLQSIAIDDLGLSSESFLGDVERFLDLAGVLSNEVFCSVSTRSLAESLQEEDEKEAAFCDEPGCGRRFAHEHVGGKSGASFLADSEALGVNAMRRF